MSSRIFHFGLTAPKKVRTIDHEKNFIKFLRKNQVDTVIDIRKTGISQWFYWFDKRMLVVGLPKIGINYLHWKELSNPFNPAKFSHNDIKNKYIQHILESQEGKLKEINKLLEDNHGICFVCQCDLQGNKKKLGFADCHRLWLIELMGYKKKNLLH